MFGIDWDGPLPSQQWGSLQDNIIVPETVIPSQVNIAFQNMQAMVDPMGETSSYGIDLFEKALYHLSQ